jgi:hypothetical protein
MSAASKRIEDWRPHALAELAVPEELWLEFLRHRKLLKRPMTDHAQYLACRRLWRFRQQGADPVAVIEQSIEMGWQGLFLVHSDPPRSARAKSRTREVLDEIEEITRG